MKIASLLDENKEKAFLVSGREKEGACIEIEEYLDMEEYVQADSRNLMQIDRQFFYAALKGFTKENKILIFIHSHPNTRKGELQFSAADDNYYISLLKEAKNIGYDLPLIFAVINEEDIIFKGFDKNGVGIVCSIEEGYENYSEKRYSIEVIYNDDFEKGVIYHKANNEAKVVDRETAKEIKHWQSKYESNVLSKLQQMAYRRMITDSFPYREYRPNLSARNYMDNKTLDNLQLMLQLGCNLRCKYCYAEAGTYLHKKNIIMTIDTAKKIIKSLLRKGIHTIRNIFFFGGEPSLYPEVITGVCDYCAELVSQGKLESMPTFTMVTNAIKMNEELITAIEKYGIKVTVSIDGPKEINDKLRVRQDGSGTYSVIHRNIERMQEKNAAPVMLEATYTKIHEKNQMSRDGLRNYLQKEFGISTVYIADCDGSELEPDAKADSVKDYIHCICKAMNENRKLSADIGKKLLQVQSNLNNKGYRNNLFCLAGYRMICVLGNGDYYPCHRFIKNADYKIGNLIEEGTLNLREYTNKDNYDKCRNCWAQEFCGECSWDIFSSGIEKAKCDDVKKFTAYSILAIANLSEKQRAFFYNEAIGK